jgi:hypothetical protein
MKHNDIKVGVEYATGNYTKRRVRVVEVPVGAEHKGLSVTQQRADEVAVMENYYGKPVIKRLDVAEGVGHVQHSRGYTGTSAKGAYAIEIDADGNPKTWADGTLQIVFLHSRDFQAVWADHVAQVKAQDRANAIAQQRRREEADALNARFAALSQRIVDHGLLEEAKIDADSWNKNKIAGMYLDDWQIVLDRVEVLIGGAK